MKKQTKAIITEILQQKVAEFERQKAVINSEASLLGLISTINMDTHLHQYSHFYDRKVVLDGQIEIFNEIIKEISN